MLLRVSHAFVAPLTALLIAASAFATRGRAAAADPQAELHQLICRIVDGAAAANRLPAAYLARILWQESRLRSEATSPAGAEGVAQFMPQTASERGLANPRDPAPSIVAAARLLADLNARFGNRGLAAAAYNAGAGRVEKWLRKQTDLPAETRHYVVAVTRRPVEEWASSAGADQISGSDAEPCLTALSELARSAPGRTLAGKWQALDRALARAVGLLAALPARGRQPLPGDSPAVEALCDRIRSLGARCAVHYQP
jgi:hypothetical protein